ARRARQGRRLSPRPGRGRRLCRILRRPRPPGPLAARLVDDAPDRTHARGMTCIGPQTMNLAVFLPNWVGDVVMATPALRALRHTYPAARICAVGRPYVAGVVEGSPWFNAYIPFDRGRSWSNAWPAVAWKLRQDHIDLAVLFPNSFRSALAAWLGGCKRRVGYKRYARDLLLSSGLAPQRDDQGRIQPRPIIDAYNRLAVTAGCAWPGHRLELFTTPADENAAELVWQRHRLDTYREVVCLNPGAAFGAAKHWPA